MTHPDILYCERTGYPPKSGYPDKCILCGEHNAYDSQWCDECEPVLCVECECTYPADECTNGFCDECLQFAASDEATALSYLSKHDDSDIAEVVAEYAVRELFKEEAEAGINVYYKYGFLVSEITEIIKNKLSGEAWDVINYMTIKWPQLVKGINQGLKATCLEDVSHFADWLKKGLKR